MYLICAYCQQEITEDTPSVHCAGGMMHASCHCHYMLELQELEDMEENNFHYL